MTPEGVVLDTNVLISAALSTRSAPARVVRRCLAERRILFSDATFAEFESRLWRPKFDRYLSIEDRKALVHDWRGAGHWVDVDAALAARRFSRDADDDQFVHAALAGPARWLVSGDQDLLALGPVLEAVDILSPADAIQRIGAA